VTTLVTRGLDVHWAFPALSPDGRWIAASRWETNAYLDVVILDARTGRQVHRVTRDRAMDLAPAWSPDSRWIVWSSDRTGVMNILGARSTPDRRARPPVLLTNVRTGLAYPSIDPSGTWIYATGYHVDGWEVERVPLRSGGLGPAPAPHPRFAPVRTPRRLAGRRRARSRATRRFPRCSRTTGSRATVRQWSRSPAAVRGGPLPRAELLPFALGIETGGFDLVGRHAWAAYGQVFTDGSEFEGGIAYAFRGLGNPVFSISSDQTWGSAGSILSDPQMDTLYVLEREQRLDLGVTLSVPTWRRSVTVVSAAVWCGRRAGCSMRACSRTRPTAEPADEHSAEMRAAIGYSTARSHSFQMGGARGLSAGVAARRRIDLGLERREAGVVGVDRSFDELTGRARGYVPLWGGGFARHVLALQVAGGSAFGPDAQFGHFGVGGASGEPEDVTGLELFGGRFLLLPVRGYAPASRAGRYAWAGSAEYRFPIALLNWGVGAWPAALRPRARLALRGRRQRVGAVVSRDPLASVGAEVTMQLLGLFRSGLLLRTGVAAPLVQGDGPQVYVRAGLSF
jgi:hypothetical protein